MENEVTASLIMEVSYRALKKVRGSKQFIHAHIESLEILLDIQLSAAGYAIEGMLIATDGHDSRWQHIYVELCMANTIPVLTLTDRYGTFRCEIPEEGIVTIRMVAHDGTVILIPDLMITFSE